MNTVKITVTTKLIHEACQLLNRFCTCVEGIHTIVFQDFNLIILPYVFQHASSPTNFVLWKPFNYQNVQHFEDMMAITFCFSIYRTFGNILLFLQYFAHESLWGFFSNVTLLQLQHTFSYRNRPTIKMFSFLTFQLFQKFSFFPKKINIESNGKIFKSSSKLLNFQPLLVLHALS